jgi:hypothetical protein
MKSAHSKIPVGDASGVRAPYAVRSPLRAGPKWKFESITFREVGRQPQHQSAKSGELFVSQLGIKSGKRGI